MTDPHVTAAAFIGFLFGAAFGSTYMVAALWRQYSRAMDAVHDKREELEDRLCELDSFEVGR